MRARIVSGHLTESGKYLVLQGYSGSVYIILFCSHYGALQLLWHAVQLPLPHLTHLTTTLTYFSHALPDLDQLRHDYNCFGMLSTHFTPLNPPYNDFGIL